MPFPRRLVLFLAFNLTPDYTRAESWEGTVHRLARCLCCQRTLELADKSVTVEQEARCVHVCMSGWVVGSMCLHGRVGSGVMLQWLWRVG